jgi:hypothetical protein
MQMVFTNIVKKGFEEHVFAVIQEIVDSVMKNVDIKAKYTLIEIETIMDIIH